MSTDSNLTESGDESSVEQSPASRASAPRNRGRRVVQMTSSLEDAEDGREEAKMFSGIELSPAQQSSRATEYSTLIGTADSWKGPELVPALEESRPPRVLLNGESSRRTTDEPLMGEAMQGLKAAIASRNAQEVRTFLSQAGLEEATFAVSMLEGDLREASPTNETRNAVLKDPVMFLAIQDAMEQCLGEEEAKFVADLSVPERLSLASQAIEAGQVSTFWKILDVFPTQKARWFGRERWERYKELLYHAVKSRSLVMFEKVIDMLGGEEVVMAYEANTLGTNDIDHWSIRLLRETSLIGDIHMLDRVMKTFPQMESASTLSGKWSLLDGAVNGGSVSVLEKVVDLLGGEDMVGNLDPGESEGESHRILELLRGAIRTKCIEVFKGVMMIFRKPLLEVEYRRIKTLKGTYDGPRASKEPWFLPGWTLIWDAALTGVSTIFDGVMGLLDEQAVRIAAEHESVLLFYAIQGGNITLVQRVVEIMGARTVRIASEQDGHMLLEAAVKAKDLSLVACVAEIMGNRALKSAIEKHGGHLLEIPIRGRNLPLLRTIVEAVGAKPAKAAAEKNGMALLEAAISTGDESVVNGTVEIMGEKGARNAVERHGGRLLETAIRTRRNMSLVKLVADILGSTAVRLAVEQHGVALLEAAISTGGVFVVHGVSEIIGDSMAQPEKFADESGVILLLQSSISSADVSVVQRVVGILRMKVHTVASKRHSMALLKPAVLSGEPALLQHVVGILGDETMQATAAEHGVELFTFAISTSDPSMVECLVKIIGKPNQGTVGRAPKVKRLLSCAVAQMKATTEAAKRAVQNDVVGLLEAAIRARVMALVRMIVRIVGHEAVKAAAEEEGVALLKSSIFTGDAAVVKRVSMLLGNTAGRVGVEDMVTLLKAGIRSRDISLVKRVVEVLGEKTVIHAVEKHGMDLLHTAMWRSRDTTFVEDMIQLLGQEAMRESAEKSGGEFLEYALRYHDVSLVHSLMDFLEDKMLRAIVEKNGVALLAAAMESRHVAHVRCIADILGDMVNTVTEVESAFTDGLLEIARETAGNVEVFKTLLGILSRKPRDDAFAAKVIIDSPRELGIDVSTTKWTSREHSVLDAAVRAGNVEIVQASIDQMRKGLAPWEVANKCTTTLHLMQAKGYATDRLFSQRELDVQSVLLQVGAEPIARDLIRLMNADVDKKRWRTCFLDSVCRAQNPFIPGVNLLVVLREATRISPEGRKATFKNMRVEVSRLLAEILEQLPKTVDACPGKMATCASVFEPETVRVPPTGFTGPLGIALQHRQVMKLLCPKPLVLDFMRQRFNQGPLRKADNRRAWCVPKVYRIMRHKYKVPKWRMAFDLEVYGLILVVFSRFVLLHDEGDPGATEISFSIYAVGALVTEFLELCRDLKGYSRDHWNVLDFLALVLLTAGIVVRLADGESLWGRGLYSLSAPLLFSRILFFAEFLPFQGPMIQVIFKMTGELIQFGVVLVLVMVGFAVSFYSLFREPWDYSYREAMLDLFKALLGDTDLFDDMAGEEFFAPGSALLLIYLVIMTIMLLNLLIAVLSTSHARVTENSAVEYRVSKARLIQYYVLAAKRDVLPAPFNLAQVLFTLPFQIERLFREDKDASIYNWARELVGMIFFWSFFGPAIFILEWLEKLVRSSIFKSVPAFIDESEDLGRTSETHDVGSMLEKSPERLCVTQLQEYLDDPMSDPEVRQDERELVTKVEHLKLLRDRLETTSASGLKQLDVRMGDLERRSRDLASKADSSEEILKKLSDNMLAMGNTLRLLDGKHDALRQDMETLGLSSPPRRSSVGVAPHGGSNATWE